VPTTVEYYLGMAAFLSSLAPRQRERRTGPLNEGTLEAAGQETRAPIPTSEPNPPY